MSSSSSTTMRRVANSLSGESQKYAGQRWRGSCCQGKNGRWKDLPSPRCEVNCFRSCSWTRKKFRSRRCERGRQWSGSLSRSRPASWGSWEAFIPKFRVIFQPLDPSNWSFFTLSACVWISTSWKLVFFSTFSSIDCCLAVAFKKPTVSHGQLDPLDLACIGLFNSGANASERQFSFFPFSDPIGTPAHDRLPTNLNFCLSFILTLFQFLLSFSLFDYPILLNKKCKVKLWSFLISAPPQRSHVNRDSKTCSVPFLNLYISYCLPPGYNSSSYELHTFNDASEEAFAAAVHLWAWYLDGSATTRLLMGKTKLAPKKTNSVVKLELQAVLLGSRLATYVGNALNRPITGRFFWTDNSCVRNWLRFTSSLYKDSSVTASAKFRQPPTRMNGAAFQGDLTEVTWRHVRVFPVRPYRQLGSTAPRS